MSTPNDYKKTVKYTEETDEKLQKLADQAGRTKREFFIQMVEYFYRTKKDPRDINDELLKKTLAKNHDTYIRFIRAQEEKVLIPVKVEVDRMIQSQIKILDFFNNHVLKA
ncbi:MAG TPA: BfmA/BtgA family mobilization protein, partial [Mucilaginibacter sp.]